MAIGALGEASEPPGTQASAGPGANSADIRVVIVDDSSVIRFVLTDVLRRQQGLELAGVAANGQEAIPVVESSRPDVIVLDIEMPVLDGLGALRELKKRWPLIPVIMFSTLTERGAAATLTALAEGADDYMTKPTSSEGPVGAFNSVRRDLVPLLRTWGEISRARLAPPRFRPLPRNDTDAEQRPRAFVPGPQPGRVGAAGLPVTSRRHDTEVPKSPPRAGGVGGSTVPRRPIPTLGGQARRDPASARLGGAVSAVVMGSSTGGPNALAAAVPALPADLGVPVLLVQHMPPTFTKMLADRLNNQSTLAVVEAEAGMPAEAGHLYVAPGGMHMVVCRSGKTTVIGLNDGPPENFCKPSVDVLFRSAASIWGGGTLGVVLTGMGHDGLDWSRAIAAAGGDVIAQDEETSVVWGMPGAVTTAGVASEVVPIHDVAAAIVRHVKRTR